LKLSAMRLSSMPASGLTEKGFPKDFTMVGG
jgi:hypothetical protein